MPSYKVRLFLGFLLIACALMVACGGGKPTTFKPLNVTKPTLPTGVVGIPYGFTFTASGGRLPYTWSISAGALPTGLSLNPSSGAISGTPTNAAVYTFTLQCTDTQTPTAAVATLNLSITIKPLTALTVSTKTLPDANISNPYSATLAATGGVTPYTWTLDSGTLPAGLTLSPSGVISGTPTALGTSTFTVKVTDSQSTPATATQALTLTVSVPAPLVITTTTLSNAFLANPYTATLTATGGVKPFFWSLVSGSSLPPGLVLNSLTGVISGTPTALGTTAFTVQVKDAEPTAQTATAALSITVQNVDPLVITTTTVPDAIIQVVYSTTLAATGGITPYKWTLDSGTLPPGLSLSTDGVISGTPTALGAYPFTVKVTDSEVVPQTQTLALTINVSVPAPLQITTTTLPNGTINTLYSQTLAATGGVPPYTWSLTAGSLPPGLNLSSNGTINGTPTTFGAFNFTVQVTDSEATPQVVSGPISITISTLGNGLLNGTYALSFNGFSNGSPIFMAGSLTADGNGNVTSGILDYVSAVAPQQLALSGTYNIDPATGLGKMTLTAGTLGTVTFELAPPSGGGVIRFTQDNDKGDATGTYGSGAFRKQDPTAFDLSKFLGVYAFGLSGVDSTGARIGRVGVQTLDVTGAISAGTSDVNDAGTLSPVTTPTGTYGTPDAVTGRGFATFNDSTGTTNYVFYVVSPTELILLEAETALPANEMIGSVLKQTPNNTGGVDLAGIGIFELTGAAAGPAADVQIGRATFGAANSFTMVSDENTGGVLTAPTYSGTFTEVTGRITFGGGFPAVMYIIHLNAAFVLGTDASVKYGYLETQALPASSNSSISGTYWGGSLDPVLPTLTNVSGSLTSDGSGTFPSGTLNSSGPAGNATTPENGTYTVDSPGHASITLNGAQFLGYAVSPQKFVVMPSDTPDTKLMSFEH